MPRSRINDCRATSVMFHQGLVRLASTRSAPPSVLGQRLLPGLSDCQPAADSETLYSAAQILVPPLSNRKRVTSMRYPTSAKILRSETTVATFSRVRKPVACAIIEKSAAKLSTTLRISATVNVVVLVVVTLICFTHCRL